MNRINFSHGGFAQCQVMKQLQLSCVARLILPSLSPT